MATATKNEILENRTDSNLTYSRTAINGNEIKIFITDTTDWISQDIQKELTAAGISTVNMYSGIGNGFYISLRGAKIAVAAMLRSRDTGMLLKANESIMLGHLHDDHWQVILIRE